ncbi:helix-turn-helix domain-containing protein [Cystobacter fuscus]|uniref:helix-turn-helix domain-containing protein n=1 Tax=Cystobacter fuscus TaxID=43 RepID=UPI0037C16F3C
MRKTDVWLVPERRVHHMANLEEARAVFSGIYSEAKLEPSRQPAFSCELKVTTCESIHFVHGTWPTGGRCTIPQEFIEAHAGEPISLADIVAAAGVPERSLRAAFITARGMPPGAFLRRRLFEIARQRLLAGAPGTTVAGVVASLGFVSGGRFSVEYKKLFDESPSDTLAASRGPAGPATKCSPRAR